MRSKDYYEILGVQTDADPQQIRKAYRQLALKHHPDKNQGNESAAAEFREIQEAYHILSDPHRRSAYNQKRWYRTHLMKKKPADPITPYKLFTKVNELKQYVGLLKPADINKQSLSAYVKHLLNPQSMQTLKASHDTAVNKEIILSMLEVTTYLSATDNHEIAVTLQPISDAGTMPLLERRINETAKAIFWERFRVPFLLVLTVLICIMIYLLG